MHSETSKRTQIINSILLFAVITNTLLVTIKVLGLGYIKSFRIILCAELLVVSLIIINGLLSGSKITIRGADKLAIAACGALALYTAVSDIFVDKPFRFSGITTFVVLLLFGCAYRDKAGSQAIMKAFETAVQWFLVLLIVLSVISRNVTVDGRFSGPISNPSIYALYLGGIWAVLLGSLESHLNNKSSAVKKGITVIEMLIVLMLTLLSQSLTPLIAMVMVSALWVFRRIAAGKGVRSAVRILVICSLIGTVCLAVLIIIARSGSTVSSSRLLAKFQQATLSDFVSGRDIFWRTYFRKMNLLGHGKKPLLWGQRVNPHNALVGIMYMYGVPCVIPYILMWIMAIEKSYRYADRYTPYAAVPLYSIVSFAVMGIADNVEQPFVWLPWIAAYLMMAPVLVMPVKEIEKRGNSDNIESEAIR